MIDSYRKGWALRYLREARAELEASRQMPYMAPSLVLEAIRKARNAIYYSLGEPAFIEIVIREAATQKPETLNDSFLKFLMQIEETVQHLSQTPLEDVDGEKMMSQADTLVEIASDIVETMTGEKTEN